jgi:hypothetical protein
VAVVVVISSSVSVVAFYLGLERSHAGSTSPFKIFLAEDERDVGHVVELPGRDRDDQVVRLVVGQRQPPPVDAVERDQPAQRYPLVAVDERVVAGQRVQQRGRLLVQRGVGVATEGEERGRASADSSSPTSRTSKSGPRTREATRSSSGRVR